MEQLLSVDSLAVLSSYVDQAQQRQQAGLLVDEALLRETQQMIHRLSVVISTRLVSQTATHK